MVFFLRCASYYYVFIPISHHSQTFGNSWPLVPALPVPPPRPSSRTREASNNPGIFEGRRDPLNLFRRTRTDEIPETTETADPEIRGSSETRPVRARSYSARDRTRPSRPSLCQPCLKFAGHDPFLPSHLLGICLKRPEDRPRLCRQVVPSVRTAILEKGKGGVHAKRAGLSLVRAVAAHVRILKDVFFVRLLGTQVDVMIPDSHSPRSTPGPPLWSHGPSQYHTGGTEWNLNSV